jgi:c(7)-type cytochrome triheme protein
VADASAQAAASKPLQPPPERPKPRPTLKVTDRDPIHDTKNPAYAQLQKPSQALRGFPLDDEGRVDWVEALRQKLISPRADLHGRQSMTLRDDTIVLTNTREMPHVRVPHREHTEWLACSNCHPRPFSTVRGESVMNMDAIFRGEACGACHDRVAFSTYSCERCHSIPHAGSGKPWW